MRDVQIVKDKHEERSDDKVGYGQYLVACFYPPCSSQKLSFINLFFFLYLTHCEAYKQYVPESQKNLLSARTFCAFLL